MRPDPEFGDVYENAIGVRMMILGRSKGEAMPWWVLWIEGWKNNTKEGYSKGQTTDWYMGFENWKKLTDV